MTADELKAFLEENKADIQAATGTAFSAMLSALHEVSEYLDGFVDVVDGDYGEQWPNKAMSLKAEVDDAISLAERQQPKCDAMTGEF